MTATAGSTNERETDLFGHFLPKLDPQQSSEHRSSWERALDRKSARDEARLERWYAEWAGTVYHAKPVEIAFRHRGWAADRGRVRAAMVRTAVPAGRLEKFDHCGAACTVEVATDGSGVRLRGSYCGDRWCQPCCTARVTRIVSNIARLAEGRPLYFGTVTARSATEDLAGCLRHVLESFKRLRATKEFETAARGGCFTVEVTRGKRGDHWHVHVHWLHVGGFLCKFSLSKLWRVASRGSYIVDIQRSRDADRHVKYVASYAAKGWDRRLLNDEDRTDEAMIALKGRRLISTFGDWYNADVADETTDDREYRSVGSITTIAAAACRGEAWAVGILQRLGVAVEQPLSGEVLFRRSASNGDPPCEKIQVL